MDKLESYTSRGAAWRSRLRRLLRNYEQRLDVSEAMIFMALGSSSRHRIRFQ